MCLSVRKDISGTTRAIFHNLLCMLPMTLARSSSSVVAICYVGHFGFVDDIIFFYNGLYSGTNFATKDRFLLNLLIFHKVGHNSISYY